MVYGSQTLSVILEVSGSSKEVFTYCQMRYCEVIPITDGRCNQAMSSKKPCMSSTKFSTHRDKLWMSNLSNVVKLSCDIVAKDWKRIDTV